MKLGIPQWCLPGGRTECISAASRLGLHYIHVDLGSHKDGYPLWNEGIQEQLRQDAEENNIKIVAMALNDLCKNAFVKEEQKDIAYETLRKGVEAAHKMKIPALTIPSFGSNLIQTKADYEKTIEAYKYLCDLAGQHDVTVYTENVMLPEELHDFMNRVHADNLKLLYDSQNYHVVKDYDSAALLEQFMEGFDLGDFLHIKDGNGGMGNRYLGEGSSNVQKCMEVLKRKNYDGIIILENNYGKLPVPEGWEGDPLAGARKDLKTLQEIYLR